jgi:hypothetical protein
VISVVDLWSQALHTIKSHYGYYADILGYSQKSMQILSRRSKVSSRRFYENFTSNKPCKSYVCDMVQLSLIHKLTLKIIMTSFEWGIENPHCMMCP